MITDELMVEITNIIKKLRTIEQELYDLRERGDPGWFDHTPMKKIQEGIESLVDHTLEQVRYSAVAEANTKWELNKLKEGD